jgi:hypothetical protein
MRARRAQIDDRQHLCVHRVDQGREPALILRRDPLLRMQRCQQLASRRLCDLGDPRVRDPQGGD